MTAKLSMIGPPVNGQTCPFVDLDYAESSRGMIILLHMKQDILILGAGIQGLCCALALSNLGIPVTVIDKSEEPLSRSGLRNEGKIHLGFIYANDKSFRTASLMLKSALHFAPLMESFLGKPINWDAIRSRRFNYLILKETLLPEDEIINHYTRLQAEYEKIRSGDLHYLGLRPDRLWTDTHLDLPQLNPEAVKRCIPTNEFGIDLDAFRLLIVKEVNSRQNIRFLGNHQIDNIIRTTDGFEVTGISNGNPWNIKAEKVINCLWEQRLYFDKQLGIHPDRKWVYRLKHRILGIPPPAIAALDSFTCVLGAFGDLVNYDHTLSYLSWYPECMTGWSTELTTPAEWEPACNGQLPPGASTEWVAKALDGLNHIFPGLSSFDVRHLDGGIIFSWGKSDIDDMGSELHKRSDIGIHYDNGYYSIDTGKFTSAPYFANQLQKMFL